jgi:hypothetical protein
MAFPAHFIKLGGGKRPCSAIGTAIVARPFSGVRAKECLKPADPSLSSIAIAGSVAGTGQRAYRSPSRRSQR